MTLTNKQSNLVILVVLALLLALVIFGGGYYPALGALLGPVGFWFRLRREPEQARIRPGIRLLGWIFVAVAVVAIVGAVIEFSTGR